MRGHTSFRWSLALAIAAHVALAWAMGAGAGAGHVAASSRPQELEVIVDREPPPAEVPAAVDPSQPAAPAKTQAGAVARAPSHASGEPAGAPTSPEPIRAPEGASDAPWTFSPTVTAGGGAGDAGAADVAGRALAAATHAGVNATLSAEQAEEDARPPRPVFSPHDLALGLGPGGQFVTSAREKVRTSLVPDEARALLEFRTDLAGALVSVRVLDASSDPAAWAQVASELQSAAASFHSERVPRGGKGVAVVLEITSALKTAGGRSPNDSALKKAWGAFQDPVGTVMDSKVPIRRMVAAHVVDAQVL